MRQNFVIVILVFINSFANASANSALLIYFRRISSMFYRQLKRTRIFPIAIFAVEKKSESLSRTFDRMSDRAFVPNEIHRRSRVCCSPRRGSPGFRGPRPPRRGPQRPEETGGDGGAEGVDRWVVRGRVGFRTARPSRVIDPCGRTFSGIRYSLHRRREWKTRHTTISRCDLNDSTSNGRDSCSTRIIERETKKPGNQILVISSTRSLKYFQTIRVSHNVCFELYNISNTGTIKFMSYIYLKKSYTHIYKIT